MADDAQGAAAAVETARLLRENAYLKLRCAQLQEDVTNLSSQVTRMAQQLEHNAERRSALVRGGQDGGL
jgi:hypothetical protein